MVCLFSYLFLVTLLNFKGVLAFMFCFTIKDKLSTTLLCFFYALDNHFAFYALYTLSLFDFSFHVIAWLLSFIVGVSTMSMLSYYDPSSICFYMLFDQDCVIACHLKNYLFVITYLLGTSRSQAWGC